MSEGGNQIESSKWKIENGFKFLFKDGKNRLSSRNSEKKVENMPFDALMLIFKK
jgi:hypothetical protein